MLKLCNVDDGGLPTKGVTLEEKQIWILSQLATTFSDDMDLLKKVNKITYGLMGK